MPYFAQPSFSPVILLITGASGRWSRGSVTFHEGLRFAAWAAVAAGIPLAVVGYLGDWRRGLLVAGGGMVLAGLGCLFVNWLREGETYYATHTAGIGGLAVGFPVLFLGLLPEKLLTIFTIPELRQKIRDRVNEGALTRIYADELRNRLDRVAGA